MGKRVFGVRVTTQAGDHLSVSRAVGRTALKVLPWELMHLSAFALSKGMDDLTTVQIIGMTAGNLLSFTYLVSALLTHGRRSVHDYAASTQVQLVNESPSCGDKEILPDVQVRPAPRVFFRLSRMRLATGRCGVECCREAPPYQARRVISSRRGRQRRCGVGFCALG